MNNSTLATSRIVSPLPHNEIEIIASTVVYVLLALFVILGNILVIEAFRSNQRLRTTNNTFLVGLAVSDLLVGLISIPLWIYFSSCQQYATCVNSIELDTFYSTIDIFTGSASVFQLTVISIERYLAITRPINHRSYSMWIYYAMITTAWVFALIIAGLFPVQQNKWQKPYSVILVTTCFVIPALVILTVYAIIFQTVKGTERARVHPTEAATTRPLQNETKIAATIAGMTGLFVIAWLPFFVVNMLAEFCLTCLPPYPDILRLIRFVKWMHYSNSIANPLVYAYRNVEMRKTFKRLLLCRVCCNRVNNNSIKTSARTERLTRLNDVPEPSRNYRELRDISNKYRKRASVKSPADNEINGLNIKDNSSRNCPFLVISESKPN